MNIGILDLQGDVKEHEEILKKLRVEALRVKTPNDMDNISGLIIPGGESTTIIKLLRINGLLKGIKDATKKGLPIFGTCAGTILLAKKIVNFPNQKTLGLIDIEINRNGYGRQLDSFQKIIKVGDKTIEAVFIRAPIIEKTGKGVEVLASIVNPVLIRQRNVLCSTFHPELTNDTTVHKIFLDVCRKSKYK